MEHDYIELPAVRSIIEDGSGFRKKKGKTIERIRVDSISWVEPFADSCLICYEDGTQHRYAVPYSAVITKLKTEIKRQLKFTSPRRMYLSVPRKKNFKETRPHMIGRGKYY